ncbi:ABC transporter substrate-binding protein [Alsobacter sp. SYSU BS001988]|jgi:ABC-type nitrate/sulfonate/bicarbonate transport system substrate-binding protein
MLSQGPLALMRRAFAGALMALACALPLRPAAAEPFRVVAFAGASNWPFWVGQEKGFFKAAGLEPTLEITPNSVEMAKNLHAGRYDLALTAVDNLVAYDEGQGETDLGGPADFVAVFGVDNGLLSIMAEPGVSRIADLKGKAISVDAMTTGFAFVLRDALARNGLAEGDVQWVKVGGGAQRLEALLKNEQAATLLNTPLDLAAEAKGFRRLMRGRDAVGPYQGIVGAVRRSALADGAPRLQSFISGFHASVAWLAEPANKAEAIRILTDRMKAMQGPPAEKAYAALLDPASGIYRDLRIDREGMKTVLRLRSAYGEPRKALSDPERYIDERPREAALKR